MTSRTSCEDYEIIACVAPEDLHDLPGREAHLKALIDMIANPKKACFIYLKEGEHCIRILVKNDEGHHFYTTIKSALHLAQLRLLIARCKTGEEIEQSFFTKLKEYPRFFVGYVFRSTIASIRHLQNNKKG